MAALLCLDLGTEGIRVGVYDEQGTPLATAHRQFATRYPQPGMAEQDPDEWWRCLVEAAREALAAPESQASGPVIAVAASTTSSTVAFCDEGGRPTRPAILWMDARASAEARETATLAGDHPVLAWSGGEDAAEWLLPKAVWIRRNEPECYERSSRIVEAVDYLTFRLTGAWVGSQMNAVCKANYDPVAGQHPAALYDALGVGDLIDKVVDVVLPVGAAAGTVCAAAADELGIPRDAVVGVGGIDAHVSLVACGLAGPSLVTVVAGTSTAMVTEAVEPAYHPEFWGPYPAALRNDRWLFEVGQITSGSALKWVAETQFGLGRDQLGALIAEATAVPGGSPDLLALDFFMGNRTPYRDARLRGALLGMTLGTTRAQLYRALVDAVCLGTRNALEAFTAAGLGCERIVLSGGIDKNPLWWQTTADVLGREVELVRDHNMTLRACAAIGAAATGVHGTLEELSAAFAVPTMTVEPDLAMKPVFDDALERYRTATEELTPLLHRLSAPHPERPRVSQPRV